MQRSYGSGVGDMARGWRNLGCATLAAMTVGLCYERAIDAKAERLDQIADSSSQQVGSVVDDSSSDGSSSGRKAEASADRVGSGQGSLATEDTEFDQSIGDEVSGAASGDQQAQINDSPETAPDLFASDDNAGDLLIVPDPESAQRAEPAELIVPDPAALTQLALADKANDDQASSPLGRQSRPQPVTNDADRAENAVASGIEQALNSSETELRIKPASDEVEETVELSPGDALARRLAFPFQSLEDIDFSRRARARYPVDCRLKAAAEETVIVRFKINERGRAVDEGIAASTNDCFDEAALRVVNRSRFNTIRLSQEGFSIEEDEVILVIPFTK